MSAKPFIVLGTTQCDSLGRAIIPVVQSWAADWMPVQPTLKVDVAPVYRHFSICSERSGWKFEDGTGKIDVVCAIDAQSRDRLLSTLLCHSEATCQYSDHMTLSRGLLQSALSDLILRVLPLKADDTYQLTGEDTVEKCGVDGSPSPGNAHFHLMVDLDGMGIDFWLPIDPLVPRMASPEPTAVRVPAPLIHPKEVLGGQVLEFEVRMGSSELPLGTLSQLKVGDVIRLDKDLQDPLFLVFKKSPVKFGCYLGKQDNHLALRIDSLMNGQGQ